MKVFFYRGTLIVLTDSLGSGAKPRRLSICCAPTSWAISALMLLAVPGAMRTKASLVTRQWASVLEAA